MIENFNNFRIRCGLSTELLDQNGQLKAGVKVDLGCWYLCIDTACVYICIADANNPGKAKLELLNAKNFAGKSELSKYAELAEVYTKGEIDALGFISEIPDEYLTLEQLNTELDGRGFITEHQSLVNYATKAELLEAIKAIPQPDLTEYAKKSDIPDTSKFITEIPDNYVTEETLANKGYLTSDSISGLASTDYVDEKFAAIEHPLTGLATEEFVTEKIAEIEIPDVSNFATKDELPSVAGLATETFVHEMIAKAELDDKDVDLDAYYTKEQIDTQVAGLATKDALAAVQQQSAANDVKLLAMGEEFVRIDAALETIPSIEGLASEQFVTDKLNDLEIPSIAGLASETWVTAQGYLKEHQSLNDYYNKSEVDALIPSTEGFIKMADVEAKGYITDVSDKASIDHKHDDLYEAKGAVQQLKNELLNGAGDAYDTLKELSDLIIAEETAIKALETLATGKADKEHTHSDKADVEHSHTLADITDYVVPSFEGYATDESVDEKIAAIPLADYALKSDVPSIEGLATEEFVTTEIAKAQIADKDVDLTGYAKESFVTTEIQKAVDNIAIPEVPTNVGAFTNDAGYITLADIPPVDLSGKADVSHTHEEYALAEHEHDKYLTEHQDISGKADKDHTHDEYADKEHVHEQYLTEHQSLEEYAKKSELPDISTKADKEHTHEQYLTQQDISDKADVNHKHDDLYEVKGAAEAVKNDLLNGAGDAYDTLKELGDLIANNKSTIEALETVATGKADKEHSHDEYALKESLSGLASKSELPTLTSQLTNDSGYITASALPTDYLVESDLAEYVKSGAISDMATKTWVGEQGFITNVEDKADKEHTHEEYLTADALTGYSKFSGSYKDLTDTPEIPSIEGLASTTYVDEAVSTAMDAKADKEHKHDELYDTKGAAEAVKNELLNGAGAAYDTLKELGDLITNNKDALDALSEIATGKADKEHSHEEYAEKEHTHDQYITDISGKADVVHTHEEYAAKDHTHEQYLTEHQDISGKADKEHVHEEYALKSELPSTAGLASESFVTTAISNIVIPEIPEDISAFNNDAGYLTSDALTDYAKADHAHAELATKDELATAISNIEHPVVDLSGYATEEWVEGKSYLTADDISGKVDTSEYQADKSTFAIKSEVEASLASKLDSVLFTENYLVKNPIGNFAMNAPVMGMSLKDILINILGLEIYVAPSLPDNIPEETPPTVQDIIATASVAYTVNEAGELVEATPETFYKQMTTEESYVNSTGNCFYQIVNSDTGELEESGYQVDTVWSEEAWMTFAIPETVTAFHLEQYNSKRQGDDKWEPIVTFKPQKHSEQTIDGYIVYFVDNLDGGNTIRVVIDG
jgi:hypothetical protein